MRKYEGKTIEEVLDKAADGENIDIEYLNYKIVKQNEENVEIEVFFISDIIENTRQYISTLLDNLNLEYEIKGENSNNTIHMKIFSDHDAILIGKNGKTLQALTEMIRVINTQKFGQHFKTLIDVGDYKEKKYEKVVKQAVSIAKEVQKSKKTQSMNFLTSDERRKVHGALTNFKNIKTESVGFGKDRKLEISYTQKDNE